METKRIPVDNNMDNETGYQQAVDILRNGGVVAFPTETVYGLGALATDERAVRSIFEAKGRPSDNPLIVHIGQEADADRYAEEIPDAARRLMKAFWPGPLTLICQKKPGVIAPSVTPGTETVGLRMPDHPVALRLLRELGGPLAAPSANRSGKPSPTEAEHVRADLEGRIPLILDGGRTGVGVESTVVDMTVDPPAILRPGGVTKEMLEDVIGLVRSEGKEPGEEAPRAPGMKYMHYAPDSPLFMIEPDKAKIREAVEQLRREGKKVAVIGPDEFEGVGADWYFPFGKLDDSGAMAANLYRALRECDRTEADVILAVSTDAQGIGAAIMNRLVKAADGKRFCC